MKRRDFFKTAALTAGAAALGTDALEAAQTHKPTDDRKIGEVAFPEKRPLITYSDRPPLLETPREVFTSALTPNDQFFVRWHMPDIPTHIDEKTFTINIKGLVKQELQITLDQLKNDFEQVEIAAVVQCGGNSRSAFVPIPGGIQWGSGAMGCAMWKGVRLRDVLKRAGLKPNAKWVLLQGSEKPAYDKTPAFIREMSLDEIEENVIIAYQMNGEDLPYLNGFPVRLVIPGVYSDSWIKMLSHITVIDEYKHLLFMDKAYVIPDNDCECETPEKHYPKTKPIWRMNVKSLIGYPTDESKLSLNSHTVVRGVAWDGGSGIKAVKVSVDGGKTWDDALLDDGKLGNYAYRTFRYTFKPSKRGKIKIMAKAINNHGEEQHLPEEVKWNHGGYKYNGIDYVTPEVI